MLSPLVYVVEDAVRPRRIDDGLFIEVPYAVCNVRLEAKHMPSSSQRNRHLEIELELVFLHDMVPCPFLGCTVCGINVPRDEFDFNSIAHDENLAGMFFMAFILP